MADYGISDQGFKRKRLDQLLDELNAEAKSIFGDNFNTDPESPGGQLNGVVSESNANLWELAQEAYDAFNPSAATGNTLSNLVQLNGITRFPATASRVTLTLGGTQGTVVPAGSLISTVDTGAQFATEADATIGVSGTITAIALSVELGEIEAVAGTITEIDTPIVGWNTATNAADAIVGQFEETDTELRARRSRSVARDAVAIIDSIFAEISAVLDVTHVTILENDTDVVDGFGLPAHSFRAIVLGGVDQDIGEAIFLKKPVGIESNGTTSVQVTDIQGFPHTISFQRPTEIPIYVRVDVTALTGFPVTGADDIKQAIVDYANGDLVEGRDFGVSDDIVLSRLYTPVNSVPNHTVDALYVSTTNPAGVGDTVDIPIAIDEIGTFDIADIIVNVA